MAPRAAPHAALRAAFAEQRRDVALFALAHVPLLLACIVGARALAVAHAYPDAAAVPFLGRLARALPQDLLLLAVISLAILLLRRWQLPDRHRVPVMLAVSIGFAFAALVSFINVGFFMFLGTPLNADLLLLAPAMLGYSMKGMTPSSARMLAGALAAALGVVVAAPYAARMLRVHLVRGETGWRWPGWAGFGALAAAGLALGATPVAGYREIALRGMSLPSVVLPIRWRVAMQVPEVTPAEQAIVADLLGPIRTAGTDAFRGLPRRKRNVLVWVWESVGERHLRSHHPLGSIDTPELDRVAALGSVRFSAAFAECPLSAQTDWALLTGRSPPGDPAIFTSDRPLPLGAMLPAVFHAEGYRTAFISSSYMKSWGEDRFVGHAGFDLFEDADALAARPPYRAQGWGVEGRAIVDRFFEWRKAQAPGDPFFAVLWNLETHHPYTWAGMPAALEQASWSEKYAAAVRHSDDLFADLHRELVAEGLDRDTLIVVVGDHGQGLGRGGHPHDLFHSQLVYEDDLHVPLLFLHPELRDAPRVIDTPTTHTDVVPTVLDLVGLAAPPGLEGASLARPYAPRPLYARSITWWPVAIRAGRYKLVQYRPDTEAELYDLEADTWESADVGAQHPEVKKALLAFLLRMSAQRYQDDPSFRVRESLPSVWVPGLRGGNGR